jgi:hypothetical protein
VNVVGIDVSTRAVDMVKLPFDSNDAQWFRFEGAGRYAHDRILDMRGQLPRGEWWDDVALVCIERAAGRGTGAVIDIAVMTGLVISVIPARLPVWRMSPGEWRKECGMKGNATKADVAEWVQHDAPSTWSWPQDACDAFCIALAARAVNERQVAA